MWNLDCQFMYIVRHCEKQNFEEFVYGYDVSKPHHSECELQKVSRYEGYRDDGDQQLGI